MKDSRIACVTQILGLRLVVADLERSVGFYVRGLGFAVESAATTDEDGTGWATLSLGGIRLWLVTPGVAGAPYPPNPASNDPWFQHFAIRVSDMDEAYARLSRQAPTPVSIGGPQQLPPSTGNVVAYKFRDPDGHPLELSFQPGAGPAEVRDDSPFVAIDHSAIVVTDLSDSVAYYVEQLGFREDGRLLNQGPSQCRLDGLDEALVDIVVLRPAGSGPHLELLQYRSPRSARARHAGSTTDIAATVLVTQVASATARPRGSLSRLSADPDGHLVELNEGNGFADRHR